jgi:hypothetical protein
MAGPGTKQRQPDRQYQGGVLVTTGFVAAGYRNRAADRALEEPFELPRRRSLKLPTTQKFVVSIARPGDAGPVFLSSKPGHFIPAATGPSELYTFAQPSHTDLSESQRGRQPLGADRRRFTGWRHLPCCRPATSGASWCASTSRHRLRPELHCWVLPGRFSPAI